MAERAAGPIRPSSGAYIQHLVLRFATSKRHTISTHGSSVSSSALSSSETSPDYKMRFSRGSAERHHDPRSPN